MSAAEPGVEIEAPGIYMVLLVERQLGRLQRGRSVPAKFRG
jgi:hypothetical protein